MDFIQLEVSKLWIFLLQLEVSKGWRQSIGIMRAFISDGVGCSMTPCHQFQK